jgi:hypothetical protein
MPDSRNTGVSATWMTWAADSRVKAERLLIMGAF